MAQAEATAAAANEPDAIKSQHQEYTEEMDEKEI